MRCEGYNKVTGGWIPCDMQATKTKIVACANIQDRILVCSYHFDNPSGSVSRKERGRRGGSAGRGASKVRRKSTPNP